MSGNVYTITGSEDVVLGMQNKPAADLASDMLPTQMGIETDNLVLSFKDHLGDLHRLTFDDYLDHNHGVGVLNAAAFFTEDTDTIKPGTLFLSADETKIGINEATDIDYNLVVGLDNIGTSVDASSVAAALYNSNIGDGNTISLMLSSRDSLGNAFRLGSFVGAVFHDRTGTGCRSDLVLGYSDDAAMREGIKILSPTGDVGIGRDPEHKLDIQVQTDLRLALRGPTATIAELMAVDNLGTGKTLRLTGSVVKINSGGTDAVTYDASNRWIFGADSDGSYAFYSTGGEVLLQKKITGTWTTVATIYTEA